MSYHVFPDSVFLLYLPQVACPLHWFQEMMLSPLCGPVLLLVRQEKMLGLKVAVSFLLFGALSHSQSTQCLSKCRKTESLLLHSHSVMSCLLYLCTDAVIWLYIAIYRCIAVFHGGFIHVFFCTCVFSAEKNECPIDVYFTIDTSETIALQEPPPGSLVESIKVP